MDVDLDDLFSAAARQVVVGRDSPPPSAKRAKKATPLEAAAVGNSVQSSTYKGVSFHASSNRFRARIKIKGKTTHLGYFATDVQAAEAYDRAARELRGAKALTNFDAAAYSYMGADSYAGPMTRPGSPRTRCIAAARTVDAEAEAN